MMKIKISSRVLLACLNKSKPSGCSRPDDDGCLPGVAIEIAWGVGAFAGVFPNTPKRLIADGASGISCCNLLPLNSLRGKGGGAEGFGIGGADGVGLANPSEGDTTTERDLGVEGTLLDGWVAEDALLDAGVFKSTRGDLLDGWVAEDALLDAGVSKSTRGDPDAGVRGSANDEGVMGRNIDAGVAEDALLDAGVFKSTRGDLLDAGVAGRSIGAGVGGG